MSLSAQLPDAPVAPVVTPHTPPPEKPRGWLTFLMVPAVGALFLWMIVPLAMTIYFSFIRFSLLNPDVSGFAKFDNYLFLSQDSSFYPALINTLLIIGSVLFITVVFGVLLAVLYDRDFFGKNVASLLVIAPFFVMPTVSALIWKNMIMHPVYGLLALGMRALGLPAIDWFGQYPLLAVIIIIAWEWLPFALLILLTAVQSLDHEQREAARMDGAGVIAQFFYITVPHLSRAISVVVMIETIFLLTVFAEIFVTTSGGPGNATTNLAFLIYARALLQYDIGGASAGGVVAIALANIVAIFLVRSIARRLEV